MNSNMNHICTVKIQTSTSFLKPLSHNSNCCQRFWRKWRKVISISEKNPRTSEYYRSYAEVLEIRKKQVEAKTRIIHPFSIFRVFYEMVMAIVLMTSMIYMPIDGSFKFRKGVFFFEFLNVMDKILTVFLIIDIIMNFLTGYAVDSTRKVVMSPRKIAKNYVFSIYFTADVLSSIPNISFILHTSASMIIRKLFSFLKIVRLRTMDIYLDRSAQYFHVKSNAFRGCKLLLITLIVCHWLGCLNVLVPRFRKLAFGLEMSNGSWLSTEKLIIGETEPAFSTLYVRAIYKSSSNLFSVNNGINSTFADWEEDILLIVALVFCKIFILFIMVAGIQILMSSSNLEVKYEEIVSQVQAFMTQKKLPLSLQQRMLQYYDFKYKKRFFKEKVITELLSEKINKEISVNVSMKLVDNVPIFQQLSPKNLEDVLTQLTSEIYLPNDVIITAGNLGDCMYFLSSGTVVVLTPSGREVCHLQDGAYFGEISLLIKGKTRTANIIALEICEVYKLSRRAFKKCFLKTNEVFKKMESKAKERMEATELLEDAQIRAFMMME